MTWKKRATLWAIIILTFLVIIIDFPTVPINIDVGPVSYHRELKGPDINLLGGKLFRKSDVRLGLDLQGGTRVVLSADMSNVDEAERNDKLNATKEVIENRINRYGTVEPNIFTQVSGNDYQIVVELPGSGENVQSEISLITQTAKLEFWEEKDAADIPAVTEENQYQAFYDPSFSYQPTEVTGSDLKDATNGIDQSSTQANSNSSVTIGGSYAIYLSFTDEGSRKFNDLAVRNQGKTIAPILDGQFIIGSDGIPLTPRVNDDLGTPGGKLDSTVITGNFTQEEAELLSTQLKAGALPLSVKVVEQTTVQPTLGQDALNKSLLAGIVGILLVMGFLIYLYGRFGILADIALVIYILLSLAIYKLVPVTLTLAGIAGFIMSVGVAVDANILIFERLLEEKRKGRNIFVATRMGFDKAWTSIRDSNISTLITCLILYYTGTSQVKGFALALGIGVIVSLFTAVTVTRFLTNLNLEKEKKI